MNVTNWDEWMKEHHVKIYTEEELHRKKMIQTVKKAAGFLRKNEAEIMKAMNHASET